MHLTEISYNAEPIDLLRKYPSIGWDFDKTIFGAPYSRKLQYFIKETLGQIKHNIITFRFGDTGRHDLMNDMIKDGILKPHYFKHIVTYDEDLFFEYIGTYKERMQGKLIGPLNNVELDFREYKGRACHALDIPVLIDDDRQNTIMGCLKYDIKLIDPVTLA